VFSLSSCPFRFLRKLLNKRFIMCIIRLESDSILLLDVHCSNSYVHWRLGYLSIITSGVPIYFLFILYGLYHPFWFILKSDFTPCLARCSNSYRKYFSILYSERSTVQTSITVEFSPFVFNIYRRNKKQSLRRTDNVWMPRKMLSRMLRWHTLARMKKKNMLGQKRKKVRWIKKIT
jgi:hypothetical protein